MKPKLIIKKQTDKSPAFPECNSANTFNADLYGLAVRERGMLSGKHQVTVVLKTEHGGFVHAQISIAAFDILRDHIDEAKKQL